MRIADFVKYSVKKLTQNQERGSLRQRTAIVLCSVVLLSSLTARARMAKFEDAPYRVLDEKVRIRLRSDGRYQMRTEVTWEILKEEARMSFGLKRFVYNSRASRFRVVKAFTQQAKSKRRISVLRSQIQDKPLASTRDGFDQQNQVTVAFPSVEKGSQIHITYEQTLTEPTIPGTFSQSFVFGLGEYTERSEVEILSDQLPLHFQVNDPLNNLSVESSSTRLKLKLIHPTFILPLEEPEAHISGRQLPWVDVATHRNWNQLVAPILPEYKKRLSDPLPDDFEKIRRESTSHSDNPVYQINWLLAKLSAHLHYFGDWRPVRGGHVPRPLKAIASTRFGDCKDLSLSLVALLRKLGFTAHIAWVKRGMRPVFSPHSLPVDAAFNHAIVFAEKDGKRFWLDPTNRASFAEGTYEDISGRQALVLDPENIRLESIAPGLPEESVTRYSAEIKTFVTHTETTAHLELSGRSALPYTGEELLRSKDSINYRMVSRFADETRLMKWEFEPYQLVERIADTLNFRFRFSENGADLQTSLGFAQYIPTSPIMRKILIEPRDRVSGVHIGAPHLWESSVLMRGVGTSGLLGEGCQVRSRWMDLSRRYVRQGRPDAGVLVQDSVKVHLSEVTATEIQSQDFLGFQKQVRECFDRKALIVERVVPLSESETTP